MKPLLLLCACLMALCLVRAQSPAGPAALGLGAAVPDFTVVGADGKDVKLSDFKGRVLVLAFWADNRGPANELENIRTQYQEKGVAVLAVGVGLERDAFDRWVAKKKDAITYPLAWDGGVPGRPPEPVARRVFGLSAFPATLVIDRQGKFAGRFIGFGPQAAITLRSFLRTAGVDLPPEPKPPVAPPPPAGSQPKLLSPGAVAPDFTAKDSTGAPVKLSDYAGQIVVLDFWATWCGPCLASLPHTQKVAAATKAQGVIVLACCTSDSRAKFDEWLKVNGGKYADLIFTHDPAAEGPDRVSLTLYGVSGIPTQFVIGPDGKIAAALVGYGQGDNRLETELKQLGVKL